MSQPVLILGAGINGAAIARELAINGVGSIIVDRHDVAAGATAYSSRLIHGGLRYLEYGEFDLVRESLGERTRLLRLAPQFVRPLKLFIPVRNRFGGLMAAARRFLGLKDRPAKHAKYRGLWTVRIGLWLYDRYARDPSLPGHRSFRSTHSKSLPIDVEKYPWVCSYYDAQVVYPERFTVALLEDARQAAAENGVPLEVLTYHEAVLAGKVATIRSVPGTEVATEFQPSAVINATGAWVDQTLAALHVPSKRLMGGTKGSHLVTSHRRLQEMLGGEAVYTEAADGRPIFILPFVDGTLIGTTDEKFEGDPQDAVATPQELEYLVAAVNEVFPGLRLRTDDIELHYAGVRPLPHSDSRVTAAITRRHWLETHPGGDVPLFSVIGGKLTTCRSLAQETAAIVLKRLGVSPSANSENRPLPGSENYPAKDSALAAKWQDLASRFDVDIRSIEAMWRLIGSRCEQVMQAADSRVSLETLIEGTALPIGMARWSIEHEWAQTVDDLVERRLMLLYHPDLRRQALEQLANLLVEAGRLSAGQQKFAVDRTIARLAGHFGKRVIEPNSSVLA